MTLTVAHVYLVNSVEEPQRETEVNHTDGAIILFSTYDKILGLDVSVDATLFVKSFDPINLGQDGSISVMMNE